MAPDRVVKSAPSTPATDRSPARSQACSPRSSAPPTRIIPPPSHASEDPGLPAKIVAEPEPHDGDAEQKCAPDDRQPPGERPEPGPSAPDRGRRARGGPDPDHEHVGAAGDVPVVRGEHAPGHGIGAVRQCMHTDAISPGIATIDRRVPVVDPLPAPVEHLQRAGLRVNPLTESDDHLRRRLGQYGVGRRLHRHGHGMRGGVTHRPHGQHHAPGEGQPRPRRPW